MEIDPEPWMLADGHGATLNVFHGAIRSSYILGRFFWDVFWEHVLFLDVFEAVLFWVFFGNMFCLDVHFG